MADVWRIANVIIVAAIIIFVVWLQKRKQNLPQINKSTKLNEFKNRKQKLAYKLKAYDEDISCLEAQSWQMLENYFVQQEIDFTKLVKEEVDTALSKIEVDVKAEIQQNFDEVKILIQKDFVGKKRKGDFESSI